MTRLPTRKFGTAGTVAIEYAMVLPVMLLFTLGTMDAARLLWTYITLSEATESAARCGAVNGPACAAGVAAYAATQAWGLGNTSTFSVPPTRPSCGEQVVGTYVFNFIVPVFPVNLKATSCYPWQSPS